MQEKLYKDNNNNKTKMKIEYDDEADAAYLYLKYPIKDGEASRSKELKENIILDYDSDGKLLGVEILNASKVLNKDALSAAKAM